ncbi:hypothetical protein D3C85_1579830 [compost metagenome]
MLYSLAFDRFRHHRSRRHADRTAFAAVTGVLHDAILHLKLERNTVAAGRVVQLNLQGVICKRTTVPGIFIMIHNYTSIQVIQVHRRNTPLP